MLTATRWPTATTHWVELIALRNENHRHYLFEYDEGGRVIAETGFDGAVTRYRYDPAGRLVEQQEGDVATHYRYDRAGRLIERSAPGSKENFGYDPAACSKPRTAMPACAGFTTRSAISAKNTTATTLPAYGKPSAGVMSTTNWAIASPPSGRTGIAWTCSITAAAMCMACCSASTTS
ncbi:RHS repeat domain-containing protein [Paludibacterium denitrificans]|uniref:RHS repeat protein n=1 Tax=Paludibacterium denitrificans TaxID=2675226 RepID=A0A844GEK4_9NEIS|nr:RHS repeat domain-containing protein [Paludibacterium denitrificans]MTD33750.1 hypothetical protein [Paludibacterium denitrificans]